MSDDANLLRRYAESRDEAAFADLVRRHLGHVHAAALRRTGGDTHLAEDIAQRTFTLLARDASRLASHPVLSAWLQTTARNLALSLMRSERRRRIREDVARALVTPADEPPTERSRDVQPALDEAIDRLDPGDRDAILLRFFEQQAFAEIGARLRVSEDAARMRVNRAVEKLRQTLVRRGVLVSAAGLAVVLGEEARGAAPADFAATVTAGATAGTPAMSFAGPVATKLLLLFGGVTVAVALVAWQGSNGSIPAPPAAAASGAVREAPPAATPVTCMAIVIDTSGSMRDVLTERIRRSVIEQVADCLGHPRSPQFFVLLDADGRRIFPAEAAVEPWCPTSGAELANALRALDAYQQFSNSNPVPGLAAALRFARPASEGPTQLAVCLMGDEFTGLEDRALEQVESLNPRDAGGRRAVTIDAVAFPTWRMGPLKRPEPMYTHRKFTSLMREIAGRHGGWYVEATGE